MKFGGIKGVVKKCDGKCSLFKKRSTTNKKTHHSCYLAKNEQEAGIRKMRIKIWQTKKIKHSHLPVLDCKSGGRNLSPWNTLPYGYSPSQVCLQGGYRDLPAGVYFVKVETDKGTMVKKLIGN